MDKPQNTLSPHGSSFMCSMLGPWWYIRYIERERERKPYIIYILVAFRCLQACRPQLLSARLSAVQVVSSARSSQYQPGQRTNSIQATSHLVIDLPLRIALVSKICNDIRSLLKGPHFLSADPTLEMVDAMDPLWVATRLIFSLQGCLYLLDPRKPQTCLSNVSQIIQSIPWIILDILG